MSLTLSLGKGENLFFPLYWSLDPQLIEKMDPHVFSPLDREMIQVFGCFRSMESSILINRDHEDGGGVKAYLGMKFHFSA